jgi:hypothetical protein
VYMASNLDFGTEYGIKGRLPLDVDVCPILLSNDTVPTNSYDYYITDTFTHSISPNAVRLHFSALGSDLVRVAIFRGTGTSATFVSSSPANRPITSTQIFFLTEVAGSQFFTEGESYVLAISVEGTTTSMKGVKVTPDQSRYYTNSVDSAVTGYVANPKPANGTPNVLPCCRILGR